MSDTQSQPTFGHVGKTLPELANDLTLAIITGGTGMLTGGFYFGQRAWDQLVQARVHAIAEYEAEVRAIETVLERDIKLDPTDTVSHLLVDRLYCAACKRSPCPDHHQSTYQPPNSDKLQPSEA